jgi:hypothetical protein
MKKSIYFAALLGMLFLLPACQKEILQEDDGLVSPSGKQLAQDYITLGNMIEGFVQTEFKTTITAKVLDIQWQVANGHEVGLVRYEDQAGDVTSFAVAWNGGGSNLREGEVELVPATVSCKDVNCSTDNCALGVREQNGWTIYQCACNLSGGEFGPGCDVQYGTASTSN